jgi:phosphohistidine phosphatase SixA
LDGLHNDLAGTDFDDPEDEVERAVSSPSSHGFERDLWERHGFLFRHNQSSAMLDLRGYHPPSSQRQDLLDVFKKNVNCMMQLVHMPAVSAMLHEVRGDEIPPADEALMFSVYYAAVASLDENEVSDNSF